MKKSEILLAEELNNRIEWLAEEIARILHPGSELVRHKWVYEPDDREFYLEIWTHRETNKGCACNPNWSDEDNRFDLYIPVDEVVGPDSQTWVGYVCKGHPYLQTLRSERNFKI